VGLGRPDDAATALAQTLDEEPEHPVAASLLADLYAERGRDDELADLLERQLDLARDHQDAAMVLRLALRLGALLAPRSPGRAADVYRAALAWAPESREVLRGLVGSLAEDDGERADRLEQLLVVEDGEDAVRTALALADQRTAQGDADGAERAIALGARKKPGDPRLVARLRAIAERRLEESQGDGGVPILRRVASLFAELGDRARAVEVLAAARARAPEDGEVLRDLARLWLSAGDAERVHTELAAVPGGIEPALAAELARLRSEACAALGLFDEAIAELDRAAGAGDAAASAELVPMLERARRAAAATGDADGERRATLRLASEATARGEAAKSTDVLARWIERAPEDEAALRAKLAADEALGDDEAAATGLARLATIGEAAARVDAAVRFADVVTKLGRPADARPVLEAVADEAPEAAPARARLRALYRALGAHRELASLLVAEAKRATDDAARFEALREAGRIRLIDLGEPTPAIGPLSDARALRPSDAELGLLLADAYIGARFFDEASQLLSEAIEKHGGRRTRELAVLQHHMAVLARAAGDEKTRVAWLGAALETFPQSGEIAAELAEAAMATGELELALKGLRIVALQKGPCPMSRAMAFVHQGTIAKRQGDAKKALFFARKAESEDPALAEAKALVADLLAGG
jgi:tetratricopeptide (TPR) repeat protein